MVEKKINQTIRARTVEETIANVQKFKDELRQLRNAKIASGSTSKVTKIKAVRKNIARSLTALNAKKRAELGAKCHKGSKKRPIFLRKKLTRAIRRELTLHQKNKRILKVHKRELNFPLRKFGLKA